MKQARSKKDRPCEVWRVVHPTKTGVVSTVPNCGYDKATVRSLESRGYSIVKETVTE